MVMSKAETSSYSKRDVHREKHPGSFQVEQFSPLISAFYFFFLSVGINTQETLIKHTDTPRLCFQETLSFSIFQL